MTEPEAPRTAGEIVELLRRQGRLHRPRPHPDSAEREELLDRFFAATGEVYADEAIAILKARRAEFFDGTRDPYAEIASALAGELVALLPPSPLKDRLGDPRRFAVAVEDLFEPNARSFAQGSAWLAVVDRSMIVALYVCARAIAGRVNLPVGAPACESFADTSCAHPSAAITARRWFESGWRARRPARQPAELWMPSGSGLAYANALATSAEAFVLAHEIAHHAAGHTELPEARHALASAGTAVELRPAPTLEFEADLVGAQLLAAAAMQGAAELAPGQLDGAGLIRLALGAEHFLTSAELWQRTAPAPPDHPDTHPPLDQRRLARRTMWNHTPQLATLTETADELLGLFRGLWGILSAPSSHDEQAWIAERDALAAPIAEAFGAIKRLGHDHFAKVAPDLYRLRATSSQLLFDSLIVDQTGQGRPFPEAAAAYFHLFCDAEFEIAEQVDPRKPFLGVGRHVDQAQPFGDVGS